MIPSPRNSTRPFWKVYQRGLVIDSQHPAADTIKDISVSKGIGD